MATEVKNELAQLKGIGKKRLALLGEENIFSLEDLVHFFPRRYDAFQEGENTYAWEEGMIVESTGIICQVQQYRPRRQSHVLKITIQVNESVLSLFWFNQPFQKNRFSLGQEIHFQGKLSAKGSAWSISHPKIITRDLAENEMTGLIPVYPMPQKLKMHWFHPLLKEALTKHQWNDFFSNAFLKEQKLLPRMDALNEIHFPTSEIELYKARHRMAYEELLLLQLALLYRRSHQEKLHPLGIKYDRSGALVAKLMKLLPFKLTAAQKRSWAEIELDMENPKPMQRLLQGDVGSGKTVIAALALVKAVENGFQGALMVPTEILAKQHYQNLQILFADLPIKIGLLIGSTTAKERLALHSDLKTGELQILIGTHALIQKEVAFSALGLVITDEQHRFGVEQRSLLQSKGQSPDLLVMTATPIPRTLALTLYGDLDVSTIDTLPPGRQPIRTFIRSSESRSKIYGFVAQQITKGEQAYIVAPTIDDNLENSLQSIENLALELSSLWQDNVRIGILHGKLSSKEKNQIMEDFLLGNIQVLIATTVIEVGIHVANATIMIVENAERFGLSQLHQLRGRVGRGANHSYCILISSQKDNDRLMAMEKISDGFLLAEEDLRLRGPGVFFGERQHGMPELKIADLLMDIDLLKLTRAMALKILSEPEKWDELVKEMKRRFGQWLNEQVQH